MDSLAKDFANGILNAPDAPCLSLYQPTHRSHPDNEQDPIRFQNLVKELEASLAQKHSPADAKALLDPLRKLADDHDFWQHTADGLAVLSAPGLFRVYRLQRTVPTIAIVADSFHLKPLLRTLQSADDYHVLAVSRDSAALFQGNRYAIDEVPLAADVPTTSSEVPGANKRNEEHEGAIRTSGGGVSVHYSRTSKSDVVDSDAEKYLRAVDKAVLEHHTKPSNPTLILAALPENGSLFRKVSHNPNLLEQGIRMNAETMPLEKLREAAWKLIEPHYLAKLAAHVESFGAARGPQQADDDLGQIAKAAIAGRVATLLVEAERRIPGRIDGATGAITMDDLTDPEIDDLLDDLAELVMKNGGEVVVVPAERMPTQTGAAAIYRY